MTFRMSAWIAASRLPSQSYIFLPLLVGQASAVARGVPLDWGVFVLLHLYGLFDQLYIVYANDFADREIDPLNTTFNLFSGGSRVLVEERLKPVDLARAAWLMAACCLVVAVVLGVGWGRWGAVPLVAFGLALLWLYSFPPLRLSYRGGGELLQMAGVGLLLPLLAYYAQSGEILSFPWPLLAVLLPTQLACAMATALPDEPSDRQSGKHTAAVLFGIAEIQIAIVVLNLVSIVALWRLVDTPEFLVWRIVLAGIPFVINLAQLSSLGSVPGTRRLDAQVLLAVLTTLSLTGALALTLFLA